VVRPVREHLKRQSTPQPAHVEPYERTDIYARATGYVDALGQIKGADGKLRAVDIGDRVAKDQVLARLSVPEMEQERLQKAALVEQAQAELGQAEASLTAAQAQLEAAKAKLDETDAQIARYEAELKYRKSEYERYVTLVKERAVRGELEDEKLNLYRAGQASHTAAKAALATDQANIKVAQAKLTQASADVTSAKARLKVAQANLDQAVILLNYATIKAPYEGIITRRLVDTGAFIQAGTGRPEPLFTLARVDRLRIIADIPEAEASLIQIGQPATFQMNATRGQPLTGRVVRFADALDAGTRTMRTEVELDGLSKGLRLGMFGSVTIRLADSPNALMLPTSALLKGGGNPAVFVVENGKVHRREIELGLSEGGRMQVIYGLAGNEQVITDGNLSLRDGQAVEVIP
jgi:RND family efflux transporter MFP subunit